jgi:hypothetical protein
MGKLSQLNALKRQNKLCKFPPIGDELNKKQQQELDEMQNHLNILEETIDKEEN